MADKDQKKQIPLRLSPALWNEISAWAADDFRSVNGQIEYLLTECVKRRKRGAGATRDNTPENADEPGDTPGDTPGNAHD